MSDKADTTTEPYWRAPDYCYSRDHGAKCLICEHVDCGNCPDCSPEVPD